MLLQLDEDVKERPHMYEDWQQHNNKLWAHVKSRTQEQILETICGWSRYHHDEFISRISHDVRGGDLT